MAAFFNCNWDCSNLILDDHPTTFSDVLCLSKSSYKDIVFNFYNSQIYLLKHAILNLKLSAIMKTLISDYISQMQFKIDLKCILFNYTIKTKNTIKS